VKRLFFTCLVVTALSLVSVESMNLVNNESMNVGIVEGMNKDNWHLDFVQKQAFNSQLPDRYEVNSLTLDGKCCHVQMNVHTGDTSELTDLFFNVKCLKHLRDEDDFIRCVKQFDWRNNAFIVKQVSARKIDKDTFDHMNRLGLHEVADSQKLFRGLMLFFEKEFSFWTESYHDDIKHMAKILTVAGVKDPESFLYLFRCIPL